MANQQAIRDANNNETLLVADSTGLESRLVKQGANGGIPVEVVGQGSAGQASIPYRSLSVVATVQQISATAVYLMGYYISNRAGAERFLKIWFKPSASVTIGTTAPDMTIPLAAAQSANLSNMIVFPAGATGLSIAATTAIADTDTTAPAANDVVANIFTRAT
jgi:hypothetical protein